MYHDIENAHTSLIELVIVKYVKTYSIKNQSNVNILLYIKKQKRKRFNDEISETQKKYSKDCIYENGVIF